jgi:hypothetical protein
MPIYDNLYFFVFICLTPAYILDYSKLCIGITLRLILQEFLSFILQMLCDEDKKYIIKNRLNMLNIYVPQNELILILNNRVNFTSGINNFW